MLSKNSHKENCLYVTITIQVHDGVSKENLSDAIIQVLDSDNNIISKNEFKTSKNGELRIREKKKDFFVLKVIKKNYKTKQTIVRGDQYSVYTRVSLYK